MDYANKRSLPVLSIQPLWLYGPQILCHCLPSMYDRGNALKLSQIDSFRVSARGSSNFFPTRNRVFLSTNAIKHPVRHFPVTVSPSQSPTRLLVAVLVGRSPLDMQSGIVPLRSSHTPMELSADRTLASSRRPCNLCDVFLMM